MQTLCITDDVYWNFENDVEKNKSKEELFLIPHKLSIKYFEDNIDEYLGEHKINLMDSHYTFITGYDIDTIELIYDDFNIFRKVLIAFRLLKEGAISLSVIYGMDEDGIYTRLPINPEEYEYYGGYDFNIKEFDTLKKIFTQLNNYDFINNSYMKIVIRWFNKTYYTNYEDEKIIYLCISLESLFCKGEYYSNKGSVIGLSCSMLIGESEKERSEIQNNIIELFKIRNLIVHGKKHKKNVRDIIDLITDYIKQSILKIIEKEFTK